MAATREGVLEALKSITDPVSGSDIVSAGVVRALNVEGETVRFVLEIDPAYADPDGVTASEIQSVIKQLKEGRPRP